MFDNARPKLDRRGFFHMVGGVSLPLLMQACGEPQEDLGPTQLRAVNSAATVPVSVLRAKKVQNLIDEPEHLSLDNAMAQHLALGDQCRIVREDGSVALYTVGEIRNELSEDRVRMGLGARTRLGTTGEFAGLLQTTVVAAGLSDDEAKANSEFVERLIDDGNNVGLVTLAPHGGWIERYTDDQAEHVATLLAGKGASAWFCKGYKQGGGSFERWHITSSDISRHSFPGLDTIADRSFAYAVSFHGASHDLVLIGGAAPLELKQLVYDALSTVLAGSGIPIEIASAVDEYNGDSPNNIVNWLTADGLGGVQLEQSYRAREVFGLDIATAVASVYDALL